jgi:molybdopterin-guanine dinucleotide biosynthesis protein A
MGGSHARPIVLSLTGIGRERKMAQSPSGVASVILAGGEGSRLGGVVKANIEWGGERLIERLVRMLGETASPVLIAHGRHDPGRLDLPAGCIPVADLETDQGGPLVGVASALAWLARNRPETGFLVSAAVDTPLLPADFVARTLAKAIETGAEVVVARCGGQLYPTNALWSVAAFKDLPEQVLAGTAPFSLKRLLERRRAVPLDWAVGPSGDPFQNINTPEDLARFGAHLPDALSP